MPDATQSWTMTATGARLWWSTACATWPRCGPTPERRVCRPTTTRSAVAVARTSSCPADPTITWFVASTSRILRTPQFQHGGQRPLDLRSEDQPRIGGGQRDQPQVQRQLAGVDRTQSAPVAGRFVEREEQDRVSLLFDVHPDHHGMMGCGGGVPSARTRTTGRSTRTMVDRLTEPTTNPATPPSACEPRIRTSASLPAETSRLWRPQVATWW